MSNPYDDQDLIYVPFLHLKVYVCFTHLFISTALFFSLTSILRTNLGKLYTWVYSGPSFNPCFFYFPFFFMIHLCFFTIPFSVNFQPDRFGYMQLSPVFRHKKFAPVKSMYVNKK